jgi:GNAT superfamily N-acetyltransferase
LVEPGQYSYKIRGIEPSDLARFPSDVHKLFWSWVVELGLKIKAKEILAGIDVTGTVMSISEKTRKRRKSAMTSSGKGDPNAPALIPGWQKSRTYSLLAGRPFTTHAEFYWRYDPWTGKQWGKILRYLADKGLDTIGLSPQGQAILKVQSWDRWAKYKAGTLAERLTKLPGRPVMPKVEVPQVGAYERQYVTPGGMVLGAPGRGKIETTGLMTPEEWRRYFTGPARAAPPGRPAYPPSRSPISGPGYQRIIGYTWPQGPRRGPGAMAAAGITPGPRIPSFGQTRARLAPAMSPREIATVTENILGRSIKLRELASLSGATSTAKVNIVTSGVSILMAVDDVKYSALRELTRAPDGMPILRARTFYVSEDEQGKGIGREVLGRMIETASKLGIDRIETEAARGPGELGYYVWPLFGYDAEIPIAMQNKLPSFLAGMKRVSQIMTTPEGQQWWKESGAALTMQFDLAPGSYSRQTWERYLRAKIAQGQKTRAITRTSAKAT